MPEMTFKQAVEIGGDKWIDVIYWHATTDAERKRGGQFFKDEMQEYFAMVRAEHKSFPPRH